MLNDISQTSSELREWYNLLSLQLHSPQLELDTEKYCVRQGNQPVCWRSWLNYDAHFTLGLNMVYACVKCHMQDAQTTLHRQGLVTLCTSLQQSKKSIISFFAVKVSSHGGNNNPPLKYKEFFYTAMMKLTLSNFWGPSEAWMLSLCNNWTLMKRNYNISIVQFKPLSKSI